ncbi:MAG: class I SAM-dependent RNA methyltransferase [Candidatus Kapabacteria bacterium]|nr:class I SAM-dependent RNA methyltransferase [Candidatus Kapabacteria bacterium]
MPYKPTSPKPRKQPFFKREEPQNPRDFSVIMAGISCIPTRNAEPFAQEDYQKECEWKNDAIQKFWKVHRLRGNPKPLIPSPKARGYRTTSKRRVWDDHGTLSLRFADGSGTMKRDVAESTLDCPEHHNIYHTIANKLTLNSYIALAQVMNYVVVRGTYTEFTVILNVGDIDAQVVRKLKSLAEILKKECPKVVSCFAYHDPTRSAYYLDQTPLDSKTIRLKKLFGFDYMRIALAGKTFFVPPTGFTQVNESMVTPFVQSIRSMLAPTENQRLLDLYCGYGLFSFAYGDAYKEIVGIEQEGESIQAARIMAEKTEHTARMKFLTGNINGDFIEHKLPRKGSEEHIILDPPRKGVEENVIQTITERNPEKVVHIFCGVDEIPDSLRLWNQHGYATRDIQPFDMFAGTANMEIAILLSK